MFMEEVNKMFQIRFPPPYLANNVANIISQRLFAKARNVSVSEQTCCVVF